MPVLSEEVQTPMESVATNAHGFKKDMIVRPKGGGKSTHVQITFIDSKGEKMDVRGLSSGSKTQYNKNTKDYEKV